MNIPDNKKKLSERLCGLRQQLVNVDHDRDSLVAIADEFSKLGVEAGNTSQEVVQRGAELLVLVSELAANWNSVEQSGGSREEAIDFLGDGIAILDAAVETGDHGNINSLIDIAKDIWPDYLSVFEEDLIATNSNGSEWDTEWDSQWDNDGEREGESDGHMPDANQIAMMLSALSGAENVANSEPIVEKPAETSVQTQPAMVTSTDEDDFVGTPVEGADEAAAKLLADDPEMLEAYLDDAQRCVLSMEQAALAIEQDGKDRSPVRQFCRELHTLKGAAATVGLSQMAASLHDLESSLEVLFGDERAAVDGNQLFDTVDQVREMIGSLQSPRVAETPEGDSSVTSENQVASRFPSFSSNDSASIRIRASKLDRLMDMLAELVVLRNRQEKDVHEFSELSEELTRCSTRVSVADDAARLQQTMLEKNELVDLQLLQNGQSSAVMTEVSKDITAVSQGLRDLQKPIARNNLAISRFIRGFRQELMQLRRVPVTGMFNRLQRAARDAAKTEHKKIRVEMVGENAGLEQEIQERLFESLLHVVRNSVSHGIEAEADRIKAGKDVVGTIRLEASSNAQLLIIEVRDDGAGIDYRAVRQRATEKGLLLPNQEVTEDQLGKYIFHPGFSTKLTASAVSGRGVGMDIVASTIERLKGRIEVDSTRGEGTNIRILIPLKSGIEHVMVFRAGQQLFGLPMQAVSSAKRASGNNAVSVSGVFGIETRDSVGAGDVIHVRRTNLTGNNNPDAKNLAVHVDELIGPEEVVVRKLPNLLRRHPVFSGVTLSGSGRKVLLLNAEQFAVHCERSVDFSQDPSVSSESNEVDLNQRRVLVVDDSLTARRALSKVMQTLGYQVVEAGDGIKAIELLRKQSFDLVLTDLDMPKMGGLELLLDMQSGSYCDAAKVVVSSRDEQMFREQAAEAGANDYITKPITNKNVQRMLENLGLLEISKGSTHDE